MKLGEANIVLRLDKQGRLEVGKDHYYHSRCKCGACQDMGLGQLLGDIVVMDHTGQHRMVHPSLVSAEEKVRLTTRARKLGLK